MAYVCDCGKHTKSGGALTQHQKTCRVILEQSRESYKDARRAAALEGAEQDGQREPKRLRRISPTVSSVLPTICCYVLT